jgi:hypothetical protein
MDQETGTELSHDDDSEDVYDLYNACNGEVDMGRDNNAGRLSTGTV